MRSVQRFVGMVCVSTLAVACSGQSAISPANPQSAVPAPASAMLAPAGLVHVAAAGGSGFTVKPFATGGALTKPDPIVMFNGYVYVAYQNASGATGGGTSTIVKYKAGGIIVARVDIAGRCDGMRLNPYTHDLWMTVNEDGNSSLYVASPSLSAPRHYTFSSAAHGGGYDDLAFVNHTAFVAASNPSLNQSGINTGPALVKVTLDGTTAHVTPVLYGNSTARDRASGATVTLDLTDPDSLAVSPRGDLALVSQGDSEIVYIAAAGTASQSVSRLSVGTQLDDVAWASEGDGVFYVADSKSSTIYQVKGSIASGSLYAEAPSDSSVAGFVGTVNESTGTITPLLTGFQSPTGLIFVSDRD